MQDQSSGCEADIQTIEHLRYKHLHCFQGEYPVADSFIETGLKDPLIRPPFDYILLLTSSNSLIHPFIVL